MQIFPRTQASTGRYDRPKLLGWQLEVDRRESGLIAVSLPFFSMIGHNLRTTTKELGERAKHEEAPHATVPATPGQVGRIALCIGALDPNNLPAHYMFDPATGHHETTAEATEAVRLAHRSIVNALVQTHFLEPQPAIR